jgi:hypothetical protein
MRIIGKSNSFMFLAEISAAEIDLLAGKKIGNGQGGYCHNEERVIPTGTIFNIEKAFEQIHRNGQRKREIETLRATLNAMLVGLDMIGPLIEEPKVEETEPAA